jgi:AraC-like DNA-binding protein
MLRSILILDLYQAVLFAVFLLAGRSSRGRGNRILGFFFVCLSFHYLARLVLEINGTLYQYFEYFTFPAALMLFPLFSTYVRALAGRQPVGKRLLFHSLPALCLGAVYAVLYGRMPLADKVAYFACSYRDLFSFDNHRYSAALISSFFLFAFIPIQALFYSADSMRFLLRHRRTLKENFSTVEQKALTWVMVSAALFCADAIAGVGMIFLSSDLAEMSYFIISLPIFAVIGMRGLMQLPIYREEELEKNIADTPAEATADLKSAANGDSAVATETTNAALQTRLLAYFEEQLPYLDPELSIMDVARALSTNKTYISRTLNTAFGASFYSFVNKYRIEAAKKKLTDPSSGHLSVEGIASLSGFRSLSAFYGAFKAVEGTTPSAYRIRMPAATFRKTMS